MSNIADMMIEDDRALGSLVDALEERDIGERVGEVASHDGLRLLEGEGGLDSRGKVPQRRGGDPGRAREVFRCVVLRARDFSLPLGAA